MIHTKDDITNEAKLIRDNIIKSNNMNILIREINKNKALIHAITTAIGTIEEKYIRLYKSRYSEPMELDTVYRDWVKLLDEIENKNSKLREELKKL